jgi:hypothetical protein
MNHLTIAIFMIGMSVSTATANNGFITVEDVVVSSTVTTETTTTMGRSGRTPPNDHAASSRGVSKETTTTTTTVVGDVTGPRGQLDKEVYDCNQCESSNTETTVTVETTSSGPGMDR